MEGGGGGHFPIYEDRVYGVKGRLPTNSNSVEKDKSLSLLRWKRVQFSQGAKQRQETSWRMEHTELSPLHYKSNSAKPIFHFEDIIKGRVGIKYVIRI